MRYEVLNMQYAVAWELYDEGLLENSNEIYSINSIIMIVQL